jgi:type VI protein secretion system component Hcp
MLPLLTEVITMAVKKNLSNAKKSTTSGKRHAKLTVPKKGEKVSSMKTADFHFTHPIDKGSPKLFL